MFYGFDTGDENAAIGAQVVYTIYRSRDPKKLKVTPDFWGVIERHVKSTAKRAENLGAFIERLKPRLGCSSISPRFAETGIVQEKRFERKGDGTLLEVADKGRRMFLTDLLNIADHGDVLNTLYSSASLVVLLVRDRIEREKPLGIDEYEYVEKGDVANVRS